jgi:S1-C subfamily serine protease
MLPLALLCGLPLLGQTNRACGEDIDTVALYKKVVDSAVFIVTPMKGGMAMGSGSLIHAEKRYILTNYHVVDEENYVYIQFPVYQKDGSMITDKKKYIERIPAGQALKGTVLYRDKTRDLALVYVDTLPSTAKQITLAKKSTSVGETTYNIGSPGAVSQIFSFTSGKVRAVGVETINVGGGGEVLHLKCKMVTATNATNPGDSGGPLFNSAGEQVAVTESGKTSASLVNLFVDVEEVREFLKEKKIIVPGDKGTEDERKLPPKKGAIKIDPKAPAKDGPAVPPKTDTPPKADAPKTDTPPKSDAPPAPSAEDEKAAGQLLQRAKLFAEDRETYPGKLKDLIKKYPGTAAAKEAKTILDGLK